ncbi:hypothetical protein N7497_001529 [Penicillium chrysogenum]|nr:hypothetical protein N7497_001529 [Penicillium chrysogenum]
MHERDLGLHLDLGARDESHTNVPESDHTYLVTVIPAWPSIETVIQDESVVDDTTSGLKDHGDQTGVTRDRVTPQSVQVNEPSISENQARAFSHLGPQTRSLNQSQATLVDPPSLRTRQKAKSARRDKFPAVSVVIPVPRNDKVDARTKKKPITRIRRCSRSTNSGNNSDSLEKDRVTPKSISNYSPSLGGSNSKARGRPPKTSKRVKGNVLAPSNDIVGKCPDQSQTPSGGALAVSLDQTQEIFGRGILRIQSQGPRQAYFMTFLPEVSHRPSMSSPSEMPLNSRRSSLHALKLVLRTHPRDRWDAEKAISEIYQQPVGTETGGRPSCHDNRHLMMVARAPSESVGGACGSLRRR